MGDGLRDTLQSTVSGSVFLLVGRVGKHDGLGLFNGRQRAQ
jgi:hypothetical protein